MVLVTNVITTNFPQKIRTYSSAFTLLCWSIAVDSMIGFHIAPYIFSERAIYNGCNKTIIVHDFRVVGVLPLSVLLTRYYYDPDSRVGPPSRSFAAEVKKNVTSALDYDGRWGRSANLLVFRRCCYGLRSQKKIKKK